MAGFPNETDLPSSVAPRPGKDTAEAAAPRYTIVIIAAITALIGVIAVRTMTLLLRGQLLVRPSSPANP